MITGGKPTTPEVAMTTYRIVPPPWRHTMISEDAASLDTTLLVASSMWAYRFAAELAVFKPMLAARLLTAYLVAEQPGQEEESERTWNHLIAAWRRTILAGTPPLHAAVPLARIVGAVFAR